MIAEIGTRPEANRLMRSEHVLVQNAGRYLPPAACYKCGQSHEWWHTPCVARSPKLPSSIACCIISAATKACFLLKCIYSPMQRPLFPVQQPAASPMRKRPLLRKSSFIQPASQPASQPARLGSQPGLDFNTAPTQHRSAGGDVIPVGAQLCQGVALRAGGATGGCATFRAAQRQLAGAAVPWGLLGGAVQEVACSTMGQGGLQECWWTWGFWRCHSWNGSPRDETWRSRRGGGSPQHLGQIIARAGWAGRTWGAGRAALVVAAGCAVEAAGAAVIAALEGHVAKAHAETARAAQAPASQGREHTLRKRGEAGQGWE
jgi:hypothetical protein